MTEIVTADIGGTHARFAIAEIHEGRVTALSAPCVLKTSEHASFQSAWEAFGRELGRATPRAAAIAVACPIRGEVLKLTNNPWIIRPALVPEKLGVDHFVLVNDFGAIGHAVCQLAPEHFQHLFGPEGPPPPTGVVSVLGPGTGLGVAQLVQRSKGRMVMETEAGHVDFAPLDVIEDLILTVLRHRYRRVSVERIVSGPGLANLYEALATIEGRPVQLGEDAALWQAALNGADSLAAAALDRFCLSFGAVAGDVALIHGAETVVLSGGLSARLANHLPKSGFHPRFIAKGRFEARMAQIPIYRLAHPQPGLFGAAAAFAEEHGG